MGSGWCLWIIRILDKKYIHIDIKPYDMHKSAKELLANLEIKGLKSASGTPTLQGRILAGMQWWAA
jgi:hypothetical protein